jgi:hypothetical protein
MQAGVEELIEKQMKRTLAAILGMKDREIDPYLPADVSARFRSLVLEKMNDFQDVVVDIIEALDDDSVSLNEHWLAKIGEIHRATVQPADISA